jgi:hypothetical protein
VERPEPHEVVVGQPPSLGEVLDLRRVGLEGLEEGPAAADRGGERLVLGHAVEVERLHAPELVESVAGEGLRSDSRREDVPVVAKPLEQRMAVHVLLVAEPEEPDDVGVRLQQQAHRFLEAVEDDLELVDLQPPVLPARKLEYGARPGATLSDPPPPGCREFRLRSGRGGQR